MRNLGDLYREYVVELDGILWEMGRVNGIHVDNPARLELLGELNGILKGEVDKAQPLVPDLLFPLKHYKSKPETDRPIREVEVPNAEVKTCSKCGLQHVTKMEHTGRKGGRGDVPLNACYKAAITLTPGIDTEYDIVLPFNPGSDEQLKSYADLYKHKLGRNFKTGEATLNEKQLQKFIDKYGEKHPLYAIARQVRKIRKARGYAKGWVPDEEGLIYGQFKNVPETFRLSQSDENLMNVSHRGNVPYAKELRRLLVAPPGYVIVEADSSSIEAVFSGKLMGSPSYMDLAQKGIHAAWGLQTLKMPITTENIKWLKNSEELEHQLLYERKKRTVHAVSYGMGASLLHYSYPESFPTVKSAQEEIDDFYRFVPDLKAWHDETRKIGHKQGYLQSPWGLRNYYYQVFKYDWREKRWTLGEDAKAVIAYLPQHANAMFQRENLKLIHSTIRKMGKQETWKMTAIGHVHDSNGLRVPEDDQMKAAEMMAEIMTRPVKQMGNITIGVQVKAGKNWQDVKPILTA